MKAIAFTAVLSSAWVADAQRPDANTIYAEQLLEKAKSGDPIASYELAQRHKNGTVPPQNKVNLPEYSRYIAESANKKYPPAMLESAILMLDGNLLSQNYTAAFNILNDVVKLPISKDFTQDMLLSAADYYALCLENGLGTRPDQLRAIRNYSLAASHSPKARMALSKYFFRGTIVKPLPEIAKLLLFMDDSIKNSKSVRDAYRQGKLNDSDRIEFLQKMADGGSADAFLILADEYMYGRNVGIDRKKAFDYYEKAAELGNLTAINTLIGFYKAGRFVKKNQERVIELSRLLLEKSGNNPEEAKKVAQLCLAEKQYKQAFHYYILAGDYASARKLLTDLKTPELSADDIYLKAKEMSVRLPKKNTKKDQPESFYLESLRIASNAGSAEAQSEYAYAIKDSAKIFHVLTKEVADTPTAKNLVALADLYRTGYGTPDKKPDLKKAVELYTKAAAMNDLPALNQLAKLYAAGAPGFPKDMKKARELQKQFALRGIASIENAPYYRGYFERLINSGAAIPEVELDQLWKTLNAAVKNPDACYYLAKFYQSGTQLGIRPDPQLANLFFNLALNGSYRKQALSELEDFYKVSSKEIRSDAEIADRYQKLAVER